MNLKTLARDVPGRKKSRILSDIRPMLATLVDGPFHAEGWLYEVKWDGFRAIAFLNDGKVDLRSRNNKNFSDKFYPVFDALAKLKINAVFDGEIIVVNQSGMPDFEALQTWRSEADGELVYFVFDLLWLEGYDLMNVPLNERKNLLARILPSRGMIRHSENFDVKGQELFKLADQLGLEGIIAKRSDSIYRPGVRSGDWLKIKTQRHQEVVIAGFTRNENTKKKFSALIPGVYENGDLVPLSPVGTGFSRKLQEELMKKMRPLKTKKCPFKEIPEFNKPTRFRPDPPKAEITWLKPVLVAEVSFKTVGSDGSFRYPSFRGLREDKNAEDVRREIPVKPKVGGKQNPLKKSITGRKKSPERKTLLNPKDKTQVRIIHRRELKFSNLGKIFWPGEKITKRDMINFYYQVAPFILPYLKYRPQTLNRFPNGINGECFFQKDITGKVPEWINTYRYYSEIDKREKQFLMCSDEESLLYIANLGCIEINPWSSTSHSPGNPDWCIIDLDPDNNRFEQVIRTAQVTKEVLDSLKILSFCKTSGSTGLHIYIPSNGKGTYEDSKEFGRSIVKIVHKELPSFTSIERLTSKRKGKIYLDFLQNRPQATVAAPYSLRPRPGAPVSMPLDWSEVKKGLKITDFTIHNSVARIRETGDLFRGVLGKGIDLRAFLSDR